MKSWKLMACVLALAAASTAAFAQSSYSPFSLGVGAQYWDAKDVDKLDEDGFLGGNLIFRVRPAELLGIDLRVGSSGVWKGKSYRENGVKYETDTTFYCVPVELGLVLMLPVNDVITLYGGPGVGYYYYEIDVETTSKHHHHYHREWHDDYELEDDFGWYAVAGVNLQLAPHFSIFGEGRYTDTETNLKHVKTDPFDCSGWGVQAGVMIDF